MRRRCLAVVPLERVNRLQSLDADSYDWVFARTWAEATDIIRTQPIDLGIIDPLIHGASGIDEVETMRALFPSLPLLLYCTLTPETAAVLLRLGRVGIQRVLFARFEDAPANLQRAIIKELEHTALKHVVRSLDTYLERLPDRLRQALEVSLHAPPDRMSVESLAEQAQLSRRECQECFARAQLPAPRIVMALIRLLYAHRLLQDPGYTIDDVTQKLGYARPRTLQTQLRAVFGMTGGELRDLTTATATDAVVQRYFAASTDEADLVLASG